MQLTASGAGTSQAVNFSIYLRNVTGNADAATLMTCSGNAQFGFTQTAENYSAGLADINSANNWNIALVNNNANAVSRVNIRVIYEYRSTGTYEA